MNQPRLRARELLIAAVLPLLWLAMAAGGSGLCSQLAVQVESAVSWAAHAVPSDVPATRRAEPTQHLPFWAMFISDVSGAARCPTALCQQAGLHIQAEGHPVTVLISLPFSPSPGSGSSVRQPSRLVAWPCLWSSLQGTEDGGGEPSAGMCLTPARGSMGLCSLPRSLWTHRCSPGRRYHVPPILTVTQHPQTSSCWGQSRRQSRDPAVLNASGAA